MCIYICPEIEIFASVRSAAIRRKLRILSLRSFLYSFFFWVNSVFYLLLIISVHWRGSVASAPRDSHVLGAVGASETNLHVSVTARPCCELFLGTFAKLRKTTVSFVMSVCVSVHPSVRPPAPMEQLGPNWMDFHEIWYWLFFENMSRKFKFH